MSNAWPGFRLIRSDDRAYWIGAITPIQRTYRVGVLWMSSVFDKPYVYLIDPPLTPRTGGTFEEIPHLLFSSVNPAESGLCLFDPDGHEWSDHMLIADTTIRWAAEWLYHYEFWLDDGIWRGQGVGFESIAETRAATIHRQARQFAQGSAEEIRLAQEPTL